MEKNSALLEIDGEEQIPVNANHEEICKFMGPQDDVYEKIFKRIRRMIKERDGAPRIRSCTQFQVPKFPMVLC